MSDTRDLKLKLKKFNEEHPPKNRPKTDRDLEPESRTGPKTDPVEIASLKMINSLNLVPSGSDCGDDGREGDEAKAVKAMKPKQATKAMKVKK